jgi:hypothetical protein
MEGGEWGGGGRAILVTEVMKSVFNKSLMPKTDFFDVWFSG